MFMVKQAFCEYENVVSLAENKLIMLFLKPFALLHMDVQNVMVAVKSVEVC